MIKTNKNALLLVSSLLLGCTQAMAQSKTIEKELDDVVVQVAYGAAKKSTLTGSVSQIESKDIDKRPASSVTSTLEGTVAGIQVNNTYGEPGNSPVITIRGFGTVNGLNNFTEGDVVAFHVHYRCIVVVHANPIV